MHSKQLYELYLQTLRDEEYLQASLKKAILGEKKFLVVTNLSTMLVEGESNLEKILIAQTHLTPAKVYEITKEVSYTFNITPAKCELKLS